LAIFGVVWQHSPGIPLSTIPFTNLGASGVALFFTLSGFLITTLLLREESETGTINLRKFYARRALRIFPLYYATIGLYTLLVLAIEHNAAGRLFLMNLPYYLTYTNNWFVDLIVNEDGHRRVIFIFAWTLATEEQFYLCWPWLMRFLRRRVAVVVLFLVIGMDIALSASFGQAEIPTSVPERLLRIATSPSTEICFGVLLALGLHSRAIFTRTWCVLGNRFAGPAAGLFALAVTLWPGASSTGWYGCQALAFCILLASCVVKEDHGLAWLFRQKWLARVGVVSYGMYMLHMLCVNTVHRGLGLFEIRNDMFAFILALGLTYVAAEASYRLFESPILRLKKRFQSNDGVAQQPHIRTDIAVSRTEALP